MGFFAHLSSHFILCKMLYLSFFTHSNNWINELTEKKLRVSRVIYQMIFNY